MTKKHVFVFGLNEFNRNKLKTIRHADRYEFHSLLDTDEIKDARRYPFQALLDKAEDTLRAFGGPVDAIVNFWDFPASVIQPILCRRRRLPAPSLQSVVKTTNKYWSRIEQRKVIPGHVPRFALFHPWDEKALSKIDLDYPFWIKPVQSYSGYLGFRVTSAQDFQRHVRVIRDNIARYAEPFAELLRYLELPAELDFLDGSYCIAEEIISGKQCTVEGFVHDGEVQTYGIIDSYRFPNKVSFSRYEYPSRLPQSVQRRIEEISLAVMGHMGFDHSAFNIEYFYDRRRDRLQLLEINSRISQSHSHLFQMVDGRSNHEIEVEVALGNEPAMLEGKGPFNRAAKMFLRRFRDGVVRRAPGAEQIRAIEQRIPGTTIVVPVSEGMRLSQLLDQDSYSYQLAIIYTAGRSRRELLDNYGKCVRALDFEIADVESPAP